MILAGWRKI